MTVDLSFSPNSLPETVVDKLVLLLWEFQTSLRYHLKTEVNLEDPCSTNSFVIRTKASNAGKDLAHILNHRFAYFVRFAANLSPEVRVAFSSYSDSPCFSTTTTDFEPLSDTIIDNLIQVLWNFQTKLRDELGNFADLRDSNSTAQFIKGVNSSKAARELHHMLMYNFADFVHFASAVSSDVATAITDSSINLDNDPIVPNRKENEGYATLLSPTDNNKSSDTRFSHERNGAASASKSTPPDLSVNKQKDFITNSFCFNGHGGKMSQNEVENDQPSPEQTQRHVQRTLGLPVPLNSSIAKNVSHSDRNPFQVVFQVNSTNIVSDSDRKLVSREESANIEDIRGLYDPIANVASEIRDIHSSANYKADKGILKYERGTDCEDLYSLSQWKESKRNIPHEINLSSPSTPTQETPSERKGENVIDPHFEEHTSRPSLNPKPMASSNANVTTNVSYEDDRRSSDDEIRSNHNTSTSKCMWGANCVDFGQHPTCSEEQNPDHNATVPSCALKSKSVSSDGCSGVERESTSDLSEISDQIRQAILCQLKPDIESNRKVSSSQDITTRRLDGVNERDKSFVLNRQHITENLLESDNEQSATRTPTLRRNHPISNEDFPRKEGSKPSSDIRSAPLVRSQSDFREYGHQRNSIDYALDVDSNLACNSKDELIENLIEMQRSKRSSEAQEVTIPTVSLAGDTKRLSAQKNLRNEQVIDHSRINNCENQAPKIEGRRNEDNGSEIGNESCPAYQGNHELSSPPRAGKAEEKSTEYSEKMDQFKADVFGTVGSGKFSIVPGSQCWSQCNPYQGETDVNEQQNDNRFCTATNDTELGVQSQKYGRTGRTFPYNKNSSHFEDCVLSTMKNEDERLSNNERTTHDINIDTKTNIVPTLETAGFEKADINLFRRKDKDTDGISLRNRHTMQDKPLGDSIDFVLPPSASYGTECNNSGMPLHQPSVKPDSTRRGRIRKGIFSAPPLYTPSATDSLSQPTTPLEKSLMNLSKKLQVSRSFKENEFWQEKNSKEEEERKHSNIHSASFAHPACECNTAFTCKCRESQPKVGTEADYFPGTRMTQRGSSSVPYTTSGNPSNVRSRSSHEWPLMEFRTAASIAPPKSTPYVWNGSEQYYDSNYHSNTMLSLSPNWYSTTQTSDGRSRNKNRWCDYGQRSLAAQFNIASISSPPSISSYGYRGRPSISIGNSEGFSYQKTNTKAGPYSSGSDYYDNIISYAVVILPGGCTHIDTTDELRKKLEGYRDSNYMAVMSLDDDHFLLLTSESKLKYLSETYVYKCETCENTERAKRNRNKARTHRLTITRVSKPVELLNNCESLEELCREATSESIRAESALRYRMGRIYTELLKDLKRRVVEKMEDLKRERLRNTATSDKMTVRASKFSSKSFNDSESTCSFTSDDSSSASDDMVYQPNVPIDYYCQEHSPYHLYDGGSGTYYQYCNYLTGHYEYPCFDGYYRYPC